MKRNKVFISLIVLLLAGSAVLSYFLVSANADRKFLQDNIDHQFAYNLQQLNIYLHNSSYDDADEGTRFYYDSQLAKSSAVCEAVFSISSYGTNASMQNIMWTLIQMTPPDPYYLKLTDQELIDDINDLILHINDPDAEESANAVWDKLSQQIQRAET